MKNKFTYITAFSGCGGSSLGLQQAGGKGLLAIEFDPYDSSQNAYKHLVANFPDLHEARGILNEDIMKVSARKIMQITGLKKGDLDVYQSSAPCQGFSGSNTKRDPNDKRNKLFFKSILHVRDLQPKIAIFENVAAMTRGKMRGVFYRIVKCLEKQNYNVGVWCIKASDHGAPQTRPRTWIIGVRKDIGFPCVPTPTGKVKSLSDALPNLDGHRQAQFARSIIPGSQPCSTITKSSGLTVFERGVERYPTREELRILSTFPKDFKFIGSDAKVHERLGNSVLPLQMKVIADHLYHSVLKKDPLLVAAEKAVAKAA